MAVKTNIEINGIKYFQKTYTIGRDANGKPIRKKFYGKSEKDALKKLKEYKDSLELGLIIDKNAFLLPVMKTWLYEVVHVSKDIKPATFDRYEGIFRNYIKNSPLANELLKDVKSITIQKYYNKLSKDGKTYNQIFNLNKLLKKFFFYAVDEGYLLKNPCSSKKIVIPGKSTPSESFKDDEEYDVIIFNDEDIARIITASEDSQIKNLALVCLATGMRRGECLGLKWSDIDYVNNEISIKRMVATVKIIEDENKSERKTIVQSTKTKGSVRTIPLPSSLKPILRKLKVMQNKDILKAGDSFPEENNDFIFLSSTGNLLDTSNLSRSWERFLKRNEISYKKLHALRHTYATKQFENDVPLKTVSVLLGHSNINITADIYTHVLKKHKEKSIDILSVIKK